jgi:hypothetical protein
MILETPDFTHSCCAKDGGFFFVAPLRCATRLRQQGVVLLLRWTA